jgi:DNA-binding transcriptional regulator PaaX
MPDDATEVIGILREYLDKRTTGQLDISRRLDFLVSELGGVREAISRIDQLEEHTQQIDTLLRSFSKLIESAQAEFDSRTAVVLRDAEQLRNTLREATMAFQKAQEDQNTDWDDKWQAVQKEVTRLQTYLDKREAESTAITVSKIGRSERVAISLITLLGTLGGILGTLLLQQTVK